MDPGSQLDVRLPIGALFVIVGALLLLYGLTAAPPTTGSHALNVWWGIVMLIFGALMLGFGWRTAATRGRDTTA